MNGATPSDPDRTPTRRPDVDEDLGFGGRVAQQARARFLNRDGSFNVVREGLSYLQSLSLYHALLTISWTRYFLASAAGYFAANLLFGSLYFLCGPGALHGTEGESAGERFADAFFFSVQTLATIGYGRVSPLGLAANLIVTVEALVGLLGFALVTGLLFARFSRPSAKFLFSEKAIIAPYQGGTALMFRIANARRNQLIEVNATVSLSWWEGGEGREVRRFHELALERRKVVFFPLHWVVVHPIDGASPLRGVTEEQFRASDPEVLILLTAVDETFAQTVHARTSYKQQEVVWGARFGDMFVSREDRRIAIDMRRLDQIVKVDLPPAGD
ncbi:MAG TPA: ion channel [Vicinamibacteria bacterium]|nr:ion channel [Vicinamibacteria bacterium]